MIGPSTDSCGPKAGSKTEVTIVYFLFACIAGLVYCWLAEGQFSCILSLSAIFQTLAFSLLTVQVFTTGTVNGISEKTLQLEAIAIACRLSSTVWLKGYAPSDVTGDFLYQFFDAASFAAALWILYQSKRTRRAHETKEDEMPAAPLAICCCIFALLFHPDLNDYPLFDALWMLSLNLGAAAALPQIWMMAHHKKNVQPLTTHFVGVLGFSGFLISLYMWHFHEELTSKPWIGTFNHAGYAVLAACAVHTMVIADFIYDEVSDVLLNRIDITGSACENAANPQPVCPDAIVTDEECKMLLETIRTESDSDLLSTGFEPLTVGFANHVWATKKCGQGVVVKRYTDLVFLRLEVDAIGAVDVHCGKHGVGPKVLFSSPQGLVMERLEGRTLEEKDMHKEDFTLLGKVAAVLAKLHQLPVPHVCEGEPMLWRTIDKMVDAARQRPDLWPAGMPSVDVIAEEVGKAKAAVEKSLYPIVLCHGDFKPSNVVLDTSDNIFFIDHELAGPNYRAFDLMKVFRTAMKSSEASMEHFLSEYLRHAKDQVPSDQDVADIKRETKLFESLTWLEAAIFFLALPQYKAQDIARWNALALDRWEKYEATKHELLAAQ